MESRSSKPRRLAGVARALGLLAVGLAVVPSASAQVRWRVSVKFILDQHGNRPTGNVSSDQDVIDQVQRANLALKLTGRGHALDLVEIEDVAGLHQLHTECVAENVEDVVLGQSRWGWRGDAINVYVTDGDCGGQCSFPGDHTILIGAGAPPATLIHEIGHYFGLCHTQGCPCGGCGSGPGECNAPGDDGAIDTIPDLPCWDQNDISQYSFGKDYASASDSQQEMVDDVFFNVMSYHNTQTVLTEHQAHRMNYETNYSRSIVASGRYFVVSRWAPPGNGEFGSPFQTIGQGVAAASAGDVVLIVSETYAEGPMTLTEPMMLCAAWGPVTIR